MIFLYFLSSFYVLEQNRPLLSGISVVNYIMLTVISARDLFSFSLNACWCIKLMFWVRLASCYKYDVSTLANPIHFCTIFRDLQPYVIYTFESSSVRCSFYRTFYKEHSLNIPKCTSKLAKLALMLFSSHNKTLRSM